MKVFLDDIRTPDVIYGDGANEEWILVSSVEEVFDLLSTGKVTHLSLDNNLGFGLGKEGHTVIPWMMEHNCWPSEEVYVHSANPYWRACMTEDINKYFYGCVKPQMKREQNKTKE